jgi:hypothetical protein
MIHMTMTAITIPDGGIARAFALGIRSFGAFANSSAHTAR